MVIAHNEQDVGPFRGASDLRIVETNCKQGDRNQNESSHKESFFEQEETEGTEGTEWILIQDGLD
jgi:hypothetical protein